MNIDLSQIIPAAAPTPAAAPASVTAAEAAAPTASTDQPNLTGSASNVKAAPQQKEDVIEISQEARVHLLSQQGQTMTEIAQLLGIPLSAVDADLYIAANDPTNGGARAVSQA